MYKHLNNSSINSLWTMSMPDV